MANIDRTMRSFKQKLKEATGEVAQLAGLSVEVGLPSDRIHEPSGLPLSHVGAIHEFGLGHIPERSFLRGAAKQNQGEIKTKFTGVVRQVVSKGVRPQDALEGFALWGQGMIQEYIANGAANFQPLAKTRSDGSVNPLNDTGALRQGIMGIVISD